MQGLFSCSLLENTDNEQTDELQKSQVSSHVEGSTWKVWNQRATEVGNSLEKGSGKLTT